VLRGVLGYPSYGGGRRLGDVDLNERIAKYCDRAIVNAIASVGKASEVEKKKHVCGICNSAVMER
jgi:hypothetical protein